MRQFETPYVTPHLRRHMTLVTTALLLGLWARPANSVEEVLPDLALAKPPTDFYQAYDADFSPDSKKIVVGCAFASYPYGGSHGNGGYVINSVEDGTLLSEAHSMVMMWGFAVVKFSPDGKTILAGESGLYGGDTALLDAETGEEIWRVHPRPPDPPPYDPRFPVDRRYTVLGFSPEGDRVFSVVDGVVIIHDAKTGEEILDTVNTYPEGSVAFLPGGTRIFVQTYQHSVVMNLVTDKIIWQSIGFCGYAPPDAHTILLIPQDMNEREICELRETSTGKVLREKYCGKLRAGTLT